MIDFDNVEQWNIGNDEVVEAALNGVTVWVKGGMAKHTPLYIQNMATAGGGNSTISIYKAYNNSPTLEIYKSNDADNWVKLGDTSTTALTISLAPGEKVYLRCRTSTWCVGDWNVIGCTGAGVKVGGNIMSLLYGDEFTGNETSFPESVEKIFYNLFSSGNIVDAGDLILPATTLANRCYYCMFRNCNSLTVAPELPATTLAKGCYEYMFGGCTSLVEAPELPATILADECYNYMFSGCTSLVEAPELPVTTLTEGCYERMFSGCTSLVEAPELPATTLANKCYYCMFYNCTNLNYIKCLATDISATNCTNYWLYGVAAGGIFIKNPNMSLWDSGVNGIPSGWTVQNA